MKNKKEKINELKTENEKLEIRRRSRMSFGKRVAERKELLACSVSFPICPGCCCTSGGPY